jgi:hypothetical protein
MTYPAAFVQPIPYHADQLIQDLPCQPDLDRNIQPAQRTMRPRELFHEVDVVRCLYVPLHADQAGMGR